MDHELVEWVATLPSTLKMRRGEGKFLLKKSMEPHLPHSVLYRPKMGFAVPLARWIRGPLRERVRNALTQSRITETGLFNQQAIDLILQQHNSGIRDHSTPIWTLLMFDAFLRCTVDAPLSKIPSVVA